MASCLTATFVHVGFLWGAVTSIACGLSCYYFIVVLFLQNCFRIVKMYFIIRPINLKLFSFNNSKKLQNFLLQNLLITYLVLKVLWGLLVWEADVRARARCLFRFLMAHSLTVTNIADETPSFSGWLTSIEILLVNKAGGYRLQVTITWVVQTVYNYSSSFCV